MAGFFDRQTPSTYDLYGPYENQIGDLSGWYADAANRANQGTQQIYGQTGLAAPQKAGRRASPLYSTMGRNLTDIENQRAKTQYEDKYRWLQGKKMYTPGPSGAAQFAAPVLYSGLYSAGPKIFDWAGSKLGGLWDTAYNAIGGLSSYPGTGIGEGAPSFGEGGYGEVLNSAPDWGSIPDISYSDIPMEMPDLSGTYDIPMF